MKPNKRTSRTSTPLKPSEWVRGGFRTRHNFSDADIKEMLKPENIRVAISIKVPLDVLNFFKENAARTGSPYQTQINKLLRAHVDEQHIAAQNSSTELQIATRSAKSALNRLLETLEHVEKAAPRKSKGRGQSRSA